MTTEEILHYMQHGFTLFVDRGSKDGRDVESLWLQKERQEIDLSVDEDWPLLLPFVRFERTYNGAGCDIYVSTARGGEEGFMGTQGVRHDFSDGEIPKPGEYGQFSVDGAWYGVPPGTDMLAKFSAHTVVEHEDGTITVSPSILVGVPGVPSSRWHGYLEHGVWREI